MPAKSTKRKRKSKSAKLKPYADFPLTAHPSGRWCKKHAGKRYYFGPIRDWKSALDRFNREWKYIIEGRTPPAVESASGLTVADLCNAFMLAKDALVSSGEITKRTFKRYHAACVRVLESFGRDRPVDDLVSADFARLRESLTKTLGPVALGNEINHIRIIFKYGYDEGLIDKPMRYGQSFKRPSAKTLRLERAKQGPKMFEADELREIIDAAKQPLRAMILLGVNCGYGNGDCAVLPKSAVNLATGWIDFPRPKTGIERRCPLWPETVEALREAIDRRPTPKDAADADLVFITKYGRQWIAGNDNAVTKEFKKLLDRLGFNGSRGFYDLRRTFETIGGESRDQVAVDFLMGHVPSARDMGAIYRQKISDDRLRAVVEVVRVWLWPETTDTSSGSESETAGDAL